MTSKIMDKTYLIYVLLYNSVNVNKLSFVVNNYLVGKLLMHIKSERDARTTFSFRESTATLCEAIIKRPI